MLKFTENVDFDVEISADLSAPGRSAWLYCSTGLGGYPHQGGQEASSDCGRFARFERRDLLWPSLGATLVGDPALSWSQNGAFSCLQTCKTHSPDPCMLQGTHRVSCPPYRFDARTPRLGLIDAHLDRQVSNTASRCPRPRPRFRHTHNAHAPYLHRAPCAATTPARPPPCGMC